MTAVSGKYLRILVKHRLDLRGDAAAYQCSLRPQPETPEVRVTETKAWPLCSCCLRLHCEHGAPPGPTLSGETLTNMDHDHIDRDHRT